MRADTRREPKWVSSRMKDKARVLHHILNIAFLHMAWSKDNIYRSHKFRHCHLMTEAKINLPHLLFTNFRKYVVHKEISTAIPYSVFLSMIFISQHIYILLANGNPEEQAMYLRTRGQISVVFGKQNLISDPSPTYKERRSVESEG